MNKQRIFKISVTLAMVCLAILNQACLKEEFDAERLSKDLEFNWKLITPVGYGDLSISDLVKESDTIRYNGDSIEIHFIKDTIAAFTAADFFQMPEQTDENISFKLGIRSTNDDSVKKSVPLDTLGPVMFSPATYSALQAADGSNSVFPAVTSSSSGTFPIDRMESFDWVEVESGTIGLRIQNNLPVEVTQLDINILNEMDNSLIGTFSFTNIPPNGGIQYDTDDLTGKTIYAETVAEIVTYATAASSGSVPIDLSDDLEMTLRIIETRVNKGHAILPDQNVFTDSTQMELQLEGDEQINTIKFATGRINYRLQSLVDEYMTLRVLLPTTTTPNNQILDTIINVKKMTDGETTGSISLVGCLSELENNAIPILYFSNIVSSNQKVSFDFTDSVNYISNIKKVDVTMEYVTGYFGQDTVEINNEAYESDLELLKNFIGSFTLTNPQINFTYSNSYGLPVNLNMAFQGTYNDETSKILNFPETNLGFPTTPGDPTVGETVSYTKENVTGLDEFLVFPPPNLITANGQVLSNVDGIPAVDNFVSDASEIVIGLEMILPLELISDSIVMRDTIPNGLFKDDDSDELTSEEESPFDLEEGVLVYKIANGFPLALNFNVILYDSINNVNVDTLRLASFKGAPVDNEGIVIEEDIIERSGNIELTSTIADKLKYDAHKLIIQGKLNTTKDNTGQAQIIKLLSTYKIKFEAGIAAKFSIKPTME